MPIQMAIPFALAVDGSIATEANPDAQVTQRIRGLVGTSPGERLMRGDLGVPLLSYLFESGDDLVSARMREATTNLLGKYEPGAYVTDVSPITDVSGDGIASVGISYTQADVTPTSASAPNQVNTAYVRVGGTVSEVLHG